MTCFVLPDGTLVRQRLWEMFPKERERINRYNLFLSEMERTGDLDLAFHRALTYELKPYYAKFYYRGQRISHWFTESTVRRIRNACYKKHLTAKEAIKSLKEQGLLEWKDCYKNSSWAK